VKQKPGQNTKVTGNPYHAKPWSGSSHEITRRFVETLAPGSRILDIGTSTGMLGRALPRSRYRVFGIEPHANWADAASEYYDEIFIGTLDEAPDKYIRTYDLVVCCDVLEHMADPLEQLRRLVTAQNPGSRFIVSVPNVAHLWIRLNLLVGRFDYSDRGILDRTHLRFFTRKGLIRMLETAGLECRWIRPTPVPLELVHPFFLRSPLGRMLYNVQQGLVTALPRVLGYQFVCLAQRAGD
jgi:2-polyprenyl-3-methyl-5-hydroxy-6-metoxy-1,4-benzoquinol methylase